MEYITTTLSNLLQQTAFLNLTFGNIVMIFVALIFLYLAIGKGFEPLLLLPISFGMLLVNIYPDIMRSIEDSSNGVGGLLHYFYLLDEWSILPSPVSYTHLAGMLAAALCFQPMTALAGPAGDSSLTSSSSNAGPGGGSGSSNSGSTGSSGGSTSVSNGSVRCV